MSELIGIDIQGVKEVAQKLEKLPYAVADDGTESANLYLLEKVKAYAPSKSGQKFQWSSEKQKRYVFANKQLPTRRTQKLRAGWKLLGRGRNQIIVNEVAYAKYVKGWPGQIIGHFLRGWKTIDEDVRENMSRVLTKFDAGVKKAIKRLGL